MVRITLAWKFVELLIVGSSVEPTMTHMLVLLSMWGEANNAQPTGGRMWILTIRGSLA